MNNFEFFHDVRISDMHLPKHDNRVVQKATGDSVQNQCLTTAFRGDVADRREERM